MKQTEQEKRTVVYDIMNVSEELRKKAENKRLEQQIEKMKCCGNCEHNINEDNVIVQTDYCEKCFELCNWTLRR